MNAIEYLKTKERLLYTPYIRKNNQGYRLVNGNLIPETEFQASNKLPVRLYLCKQTPDGRAKYLDV